MMKILALHDAEYALVDKNLIILEVSSGVKNFSDYPDEVAIGREITSAFPELIGIESILLTILDNQQKSFDIKGIARADNFLRPDYINIYVISEQTGDSSNPRLLILFEDSSEKMILKQKVIQQEYEAYLRLRDLSSS